MEERKNLFETVREVIDEIEQLRYEKKLLYEEIDNNNEIIQSLRDDFKEVIDDNIALTKENKRLLEEIDNDNEIIQSLHDEIEARCSFTKKVIKQRDDFCDEMKLMVKDHEEECEDYCTMISERVNINNLHIILAKYLTDNYTSEPTKINLFKFLDEIKKFIDNKKE